MRRLRQGLELTLLMAIAVVGCANRDISLRPPKRPEEFGLPPLADGRYSTPPRYPESINQDLDPERRGIGQGGVPNLGAMNGMGGMGGGMGGMGGMGGGMPMMGGMGGNMLGGYGGR